MKGQQNIYLGKVLKFRREELGLTQAQLAKESHVHQTHISKIESGGNISTMTLFKLCSALNLLIQIKPVDNFGGNRNDG